VGLEGLGLFAANKLNLTGIFSSLGFKEEDIKLFLALIIAKMAGDDAEESILSWLTRESSLGDLIGHDFTAVSVKDLEEAMDALEAKRPEIESLLYSAALEADKADNLEDNDLEANDSPDHHDSIISLYDLTKRYYESSPLDGPSLCSPPDLTAKGEVAKGQIPNLPPERPGFALGLWFGRRGYLRQSQVLTGDILDPAIFKTLVTSFKPPAGALWFMAERIATHDHLAWLTSLGYRYLTINRAKSLVFNKADSQPLIIDEPLYVYREKSLEGRENVLWVYLPQRASLENARLVAEVSVQAVGPQKEDKRRKEWQKNHPQVGSEQTIFRLTPGVFRLATNDLTLTAEEIWRLYLKRTRLEGGIRAFNLDLGTRKIRPIFVRRLSPHLFIATLAYQLAQSLQNRLEANHVFERWGIIVKTIRGRQRTLISLANNANAPLERWINADPEPGLIRIYKALNIDPQTWP
jgi:hypothetical protein